MKTKRPTDQRLRRRKTREKEELTNNHIVAYTRVEPTFNTQLYNNWTAPPKSDQYEDDLDIVDADTVTGGS